MSFFDELRRRNVFRVGIAYLVVAWLALQVSDIVAPILELPAVFDRGILLLLAIGFPFALIFAWAFELTPEGVKKEKDVDHAVSNTQHTGRKLDFIIIGVLTMIVAIYSLDKFVWTESVAPTATNVQQSQQTIAVLPFVNMSDDSEQEYFSDGLSEELLNLLAQIPELRVTSRTSAFSFKGKGATIAEVGRALDVEHVLEGSVRRSGDTIRITAQLINVSTDTHLWSDTWDRNFDDVFVIQDEIAEFVVDALKIQLLGDLPRVIETTPEAYALYLQSQFLIEQHTVPAFLQAEAISKRVLEIDPEYAPAWTQLASLYLSGSSFGAWESVDATPLARDAALRSVRLLENNAQAHAVLARIAISSSFDFELAARELEIALRMGPDDPRVLRAAAEFAQRQGNYEEAIDYLEKAHEIDPLAGHREKAAISYFYSGRQTEGISLYEEAVRRTPFAEFVNKSLALALLETGDVDGALAALEKEPGEGHALQGLALIYETIGDREQSTEALEKLLAVSNRWTFEIAEVYSYRGELDEAFNWMDRAIERRDRALRHVMYSPYRDTMRKDPRVDDVLVRLGLKRAP
jgi:adenylate cyclase